MPRKLTALLTAVVALAIFAAACGTIIDALSSPERGTWDGDTYTNEPLGITIQLPAGWTIATDAEKAALYGLASNFIAEATEEELAEAPIIPDMMISSPTGSNLQIMHERVGRSSANIDDYFEAVEEQLQAMGATVSRRDEMTRIGNYEWYSYDTVMDVGAGPASGRQFIRFSGNHATLIVVTEAAGSESIAEISAILG